jgi:hypothetical protein
MMMMMMVVVVVVVMTTTVSVPYIIGTYFCLFSEVRNLHLNKLDVNG